MPVHLRILWASLWILSVFIIFQACDPSSPSEDNTQKGLYVVATTGMIADAVQNIGDTLVQVEALMGPGVDPHLYKATRDDLTKFRKANIIFYNGLHLEGKMGEVLERFARQKKIVAVAEVIDPSLLISVGEGQGSVDPHIWFDVSLWQKVVAQISLVLQEADPENSQAYRENAQAYLQKLQQLHEAVGNQIATIPEKRRVLITAHDAFSYFGKAYNIEVRGLQGISTLSEFGVRDVSDLVDFIVKREIKAVFVETSIPQKSLEAVVRGCKNRNQTVEIGGTLYSDAMGAADTEEGTYLGMVRKNVSTIVNALK